MGVAVWSRSRRAVCPTPIAAGRRGDHRALVGAASMSRHPSSHARSHRPASRVATSRFVDPVARQRRVSRDRRGAQSVRRGSCVSCRSPRAASRSRRSGGRSGGPSSPRRAAALRQCSRTKTLPSSVQPSASSSLGVRKRWESFAMSNIAHERDAPRVAVRVALADEHRHAAVDRLRDLGVAAASGRSGRCPCSG